MLMETGLKFSATGNSGKKVRIIDLNFGKFFAGSKEEMKRSYLITPFGEKITKTNVIGTVVEKFESGEKQFASATIDDGSGAIRLRVFREEIGMLRNIGLGKVVNVVGRIRNYNGETYIAPEVVREIGDPNAELMRRAEILEDLRIRKKIVDELRNLRDGMSEEELKDYAKGKYEIDEEMIGVIIEKRSAGSDYKPKVLELIEKMDGGDGASVGKLFEFLKLDENVLENVISDLLSSGLVYEPTIGKLKKV